MPTYIVTADHLHVRSAPRLALNILGKLRQGAVVELVSQTNGWAEVRAERVSGWVAMKYLHLTTDPEPDPSPEEFPWMTVALAELGQKEVEGEGDNPRVTLYHRSTTLPRDLAASDETSWCSSFVNWCVERAGLAGTDSASARSWLSWGSVLDTPRRGCIVVLSRPSTSHPQSGHVGFFASHESGGSRLRLLGGNQNNAVSYAEYPITRLLGYRVP